jgi:uncharacterized phage protein (TIGR01671 family)
MREIKFRAWEKNPHTTNPDYVNRIKYDVQFCEFCDGGECFSRYLSDAWVLMQYTGLKDKNGLEIYEGDVVDISPARGLRKTKIQSQLVGFDSQSGCYCFVYTTGEPMRSFSKKDKEFWRVIGNIYENPELLAN